MGFSLGYSNVILRWWGETKPLPQKAKTNATFSKVGPTYQRILIPTMLFWTFFFPPSSTDIGFD